MRGCRVDLPGDPRVSDFGHAPDVITVHGSARRSSRTWPRKLDGSFKIEAVVDHIVHLVEAELARVVPDVVIPASEVVEASALQAFVDQVHAALADGDVVSFGKLGEIRKRGPSLSFQQGKALHDAMDGKALPSGGGTLADVFRALFDQPRWHALEIPGLLRTWVGEDKHVEMRDYLGRTQLVGRAGPFLVVQSVRPSNTR